MVVLPAASILLVGFAGQRLDPGASLPATALLFAALFVGLPLVWWLWLKLVLGLRSRDRAGMPAISLRGVRPLRYAPPPPVPAPRARLAPRRRLASGALVAAMLAVSTSIWTLLPLGWLWVASRLADSTQPRMGLYALVLAGLVASVAAAMVILNRLHRRYAALHGAPPAAADRAAWLRSLRDEPRPASVPIGLERVLVLSVLVALAGLTVWFFFFADASSLVETYSD